MVSKGIVSTRGTTEPGKLIGISCRRLAGMKVVNRLGENLGEIYDVVLDFRADCVGYAVLKYSKFLSLDVKLFAIPWAAFSIANEAGFMDGTDRKLTLNLPQDALKESEGFDERHWPEAPDYGWLKRVYTAYGFQPYWEKK